MFGVKLSELIARAAVNFAEDVTATGVVSELVETEIPEKAAPAAGFVTSKATNDTTSPGDTGLLTPNVIVAPSLVTVAPPMPPFSV